jgi:long-chain acyl-CoA synthetase
MGASQSGAEEGAPLAEAAAAVLSRPGAPGFSMAQVVRAGARAHGTAVATVGLDGRERTYAEFAGRVARAGSRLREALGGPRGALHAPVAILALNNELYLEALFALPHAGAWAVPCNVRLAVAETVDVLNDCAARCLLVDDAFLGQAAALQAAVKSLALVVYVGTAEERSALPAGVLHWDLDLASKGEPEEAAPCGGEDVYGLFYTGGTTGKSKGVMLSHNNLMANAYCMLAGLQYSRETTYLHCAPMFHLADGANTFAVTMAGGKHVFVKRFVPEDVALAFKTQRVSHVLMVPTMIQMLLALKDFDAMAARGDFRTLRAVVYGASPMPEATLLKAMNALGAVSWYQGYGQTESAPVNTLLGPEEHRKGGALLKSAGRPVPHAEVRIVDEHDREVPAGTVGELVVRGPHIMKGYWKMPELTAATLKGGWLHSGDGAYVDKVSQPRLGSIRSTHV